MLILREQGQEPGSPEEDKDVGEEQVTKITSMCYRLTVSQEKQEILWTEQNALTALCVVFAGFYSK